MVQLGQRWPKWRARNARKAPPSHDA